MIATTPTPQMLRWRRRKLLLCALALVLPLGIYLTQVLLKPPSAALISFNYMDRPISSFWVNDFWGGNLFVMGGGGIMCCRHMDESTAKVVWILGRTGAQVRQGLKKERHEIELPMPPRKSGDDTLHVYFLPGNKVELAWSDTMLNLREYPNGAPARAAKLTPEVSP